MQYPGPYAGPPQPQAASSQAVLALVLAILGLFACGCVTSIPAIFIARAELKAIDAGQSSPAGRSFAQIAFWIAVVDTALVLLLGGAYVLLVVAGLGAGILFSP